MRILACITLCLGIGAGAAAWADTPDMPADPAAAAAAVLDSAAAADILREAGEGAALSEGAAASAPAAPAPARSAAPPARQSANPAADDDDPFGLRPRVKQAWGWMKESVPWLDSADEAETERRPAPSTHPGWTAPGLHDPLDQRSGGSTGWGGHAGAAQASAGPPPDALQARSAATPVDSLFESIREAVATVREAITHPMSWLIAALVAVGAFAVRRFDRRPK